MIHVNMMSGGAPSAAVGKLIAQRHGTDSLVHLFADTSYEDEDLYRFLTDAVAWCGGRLVRLCDGRTPWDVFRDHRMIGNTRVAPCSRALKQELCRKWVEDHCPPLVTTLYVGILWYERRRMENWTDKNGKQHIGIRERWLPYRVEAPLTEPPHLSRPEILAWLERDGIDPPAMYDDGFPTNNCGGRCVKQGHEGWALLLRKRPDRFAECEAKEQAMRDYLGKDVAILRDRRGGKTLPLPLAEFRRRVEAGEGYDRLDFGSPCSCLLDDEPNSPSSAASEST